MKDINDREIIAGDYIIYAALLGRCAALKFGKVLRVKEPKDASDPASLTAFAVECHNWGEPIRYQPQQKLVTLTFGSRITIIPSSTIGTEPKMFLDEMERYYEKYGKWNVDYQTMGQFVEDVRRNAETLKLLNSNNTP